MEIKEHQMVYMRLREMHIKSMSDKWIIIQIMKWIALERKRDRSLKTWITRDVHAMSSRELQ